MNYTKPAVAELGEAVRVIEFHVKLNGTIPDSGPRLNPAYDLDE